MERSNGLLHYRFCGNGHEQGHLRRQTTLPLAADIIQQIKTLHQQGKSQRQIAIQLFISRPSVARVLERDKEVVKDDG